MNEQRNTNILLAAAAILSALFFAVLLVGQPEHPARAQISSQSTWVPASGVGGSANAITLSVANVASMADLLGVPVRFLPTSTNVAGATTINATSLGAHTVTRYSAGGLVAVAGGDLSTSVMAEVIWDGTEFVQTNPATGTAPVGSEINMAAGTAAVAGYLIENGTCISQTTYAALYAAFGSTDVWSPGSTGGACAGGQFHLPYANGTVAAAYDTQGTVTASKLTSGGSGCAATAAGVLCGSQTHTLVLAETPSFSYTPAGSVTVTSSLGNTATASGGGTFTAIANSGSISASFSGTPATLGGSNMAHAIVQPTRTMLVLIKY